MLQGFPARRSARSDWHSPCHPKGNALARCADAEGVRFQAKRRDGGRYPLAARLPRREYPQGLNGTARYRPPSNALRPVRGMPEGVRLSAKRRERSYVTPVLQGFLAAKSAAEGALGTIPSQCPPARLRGCRRAFFDAPGRYAAAVTPAPAGREPPAGRRGGRPAQNAELAAVPPKCAPRPATARPVEDQLVQRVPDSQGRAVHPGEVGALRLDQTQLRQPPCSSARKKARFSRR